MYCGQHIKLLSMLKIINEGRFYTLNLANITVVKNKLILGKKKKIMITVQIA